MNSLLLLNGSPRGERSNSMKMLSRVAEGWQQAGGNSPEILHITHKSQFTRAVEAFPSAGTILLGTPLYTDSMPALVKTYIEALAPRVAAARSGERNPRLAFLIQSGFPEALHSRPLERYFEKLARRFGSPYAGTIVRGAGEALQSMPERANHKLWAHLRALGAQLFLNDSFGAAELKAVAGTEQFSSSVAALASILCKVPVVQFYWNSQLKKNCAWQRRFVAPYGPKYR